MTRCASVDLAPFGIRVNTVAPGVTATSLQRTGGMTDEAYEGFIARCGGASRGAQAHYFAR